jgi:hypothetical protein
MFPAIIQKSRLTRRKFILSEENFLPIPAWRLHFDPYANCLQYKEFLPPPRVFAVFPW